MNFIIQLLKNTVLKKRITKKMGIVNTVRAQVRGTEQSKGTSGGIVLGKREKKEKIAENGTQESLD